MAIGTNSIIDFFGTEDPVDDGSTVAISTDTFSVLADILVWTNDDDAPFGNFVLECQFATAPTDFLGTIDLYARPLNVEAGGGDPGVPSLTNLNGYLGHFPIDYTVGNSVLFFTYLHGARLTNFITSQTYEFYLHNNGTAQQIEANWNLWITPTTQGPHG